MIRRACLAEHLPSWPGPAARRRPAWSVSAGPWAARLPRSSGARAGGVGPRTTRPAGRGGFRNDIDTGAHAATITSTIALRRCPGHRHSGAILDNRILSQVTEVLASPSGG